MAALDPGEKMDRHNWFRQYGVYLLRLYWERRTYRTAMVLGGVTSVVGLAQFAFMGTFLQRGNTFPEITRYGGNIVSYFLSGTVFTGFVAVALHGFSRYVQEEQMTGTLESVADSPPGITRMMIFSAFTGCAATAIGSFAMMGLFEVLLGFHLDVNVGGVIVSLLLTLIALGGFGMAGCGTVLVTKRGDPVTWFVVTTMTLLSGVLYPVDALPGWMRAVAHFLPTTTALDLLRAALLGGASIRSVLAAALPLTLWACLSVPAGALLLRWGLHTSRRRGSLGQY
ncbi:ABC transporter permease [Nocardia vaccinii]|uniref:ABC transporter permease n=1 Tax=Nocardia vaccinii TaxID=1822 RepID=UPI000832D21C|nr:ABC transporter permease [Nocardia vaccinii]